MMIMNLVNDQLNKETITNLSMSEKDSVFTGSNLELSSEEVSLIDSRVKDTIQYSGFDKPYLWK